MLKLKIHENHVHDMYAHRKTEFYFWLNLFDWIRFELNKKHNSISLTTIGSVAEANTGSFVNTIPRGSLFSPWNPSVPYNSHREIDTWILLNKAKFLIVQQHFSDRLRAIIWFALTKTKGKTFARSLGGQDFSSTAQSRELMAVVIIRRQPGKDFEPFSGAESKLTFANYFGTIHLLNVRGFSRRGALMFKGFWA